MRITGGTFGGRTLKMPRGADVRPTQDRVREALFSMLRNDLAGASVLDLCAGSGGVGLEALSRGAARATFVDAAAPSLRCAAENAAAFGVADRCEFVRADAFAWIGTAGAGRGYDFVYCDPPYALAEARGFAELLAAAAANGAVRPGGLFAAEMRASGPAAECAGWDLCRDRVYGQTRVAVYRRRDGDSGDRGRGAAAEGISGPTANGE